MDGEFGVRLEDIQKGINDRWACWDEDSGCFDTTQCPGVIDTYAFVGANSLNRSAFELQPFENEPPEDFASLFLIANDHKPVPAKVEANAKASTERKPWLL
ncbi:hypothetical protein D3C75_717930 [compost metagenome]